jgi:signal transduction histidine kinase
VVDVIDFVGDVAEGLRPKAQEKGLRFLYKPQPDDGAQSSRIVAPAYYAYVDNDHLREVVANLIENAIKYTLSGDVIIDVGGDATHVVVSVQDSGIGIPAEDIPHLFQKFYRVDNSDTREIGGTGLGLYLCRRLAEVMGGRVRVESEYKKGSTFYLELPRIDHEEADRLIETATAAEAATIVPDRPSAAAPPVPPTVPAQPPVAVPAPQPPAPQPVAAASPARPPLRIPVREPGETR